MSDHTMEQIRDVNPVPYELGPVPIDEVWRRVEADAARPLRDSSTGSRRGWLPDIGGLSVAVLVIVALGVAAVAIVLVGHRRPIALKPLPKPAATTTEPSSRARLPVGVAVGSSSAAANVDPGIAIRRTVSITAQTPDPRGGLPWAMRVFQTTREQTCVQIGRLQGDSIGLIGQDGTFANDHRFHPILPNALRADSCVETDGNGHAFDNVTLDSITASANSGSEGPRFVGCGIAGTHGHPCRKSDLRVVQYGLLGPDASRITYLGPQGQHLTKPTTGPDGAYLIVDPATRPVCRATPAWSGCGHEAGNAFSAGPSLRSGLVTAVTYRDGHLCRVPPASPPGTPAGMPQGSCPIVGYQPPHTPHLTASSLATPVTARKITNRPVVDISFVARVAVTNPNSYYQYTLNAQSTGFGCSEQTGDDTGHADIKAGQRVLLQDHIKANCSGVLQGTVSYILSGPGGSQYPIQFPAAAVRTITVGRFSLTLP